jgi:hypothetical protein
LQELEFLEFLKKTTKHTINNKRHLESFFIPRYRDILSIKKRLIDASRHENLRNNILKKDTHVIKIMEVKIPYKEEHSFRGAMEKIIKNVFCAHNHDRKIEIKNKYGHYGYLESSYHSNYNSDIPFNDYEERFYQEAVLPFITNMDKNNLGDGIDDVINKYIDIYIDIQKEQYGYTYEKITKTLDDSDTLMENLFIQFNYNNFRLMKDKDNKDLTKYINSDENVNNIFTYKEKETGMNYHALNDGSLIVSKDNEFEAVHPFQKDKLINQLKFNFLKKEFKKSPMIIKEILNKLGDEKYGLYDPDSFRKIDNLKTILEDNRNLIKTLQIPVIDIFRQNYDVEEVVDTINVKKLHNKAKQKMKSFLNTKTMYLLTDDNINIFKELDQRNATKDINRDQLNNHVFNNIAYYQLKGDETEEKIEENLMSFSYALASFKNKALSGFDNEYYFNKMENNDHTDNIIYDQDGIMIYKVKTENESLLYGNNTWCISRKDAYKAYFKDYKKANNNQYFYYNFGAIQSEEMMIGITTNKSGDATNSFDNKNNNYMENDNLKNITSLIKKHDQEIVRKIKNKKGM